MTKSIIQSDAPIAFDIISISLFTKDPKTILTKQFTSNNSPVNIDSTDLHLSLIQNVLLEKEYSNSASQSPFYISNEEISFTSFVINKCKYHLLNITKSNIVIMSKFGETTKSSIIKLYLFHIAVAFFNFIGSQSNFINTSGYGSVNDSFNTKLFELYVFSPITKHFSIVTGKLFKRKKLRLSNIKYKTFYLVDLSSNEAIFSLHSTRNGVKRIKSIQLNEPLWNELMYHCNNLKVQYIKKYQNRFDSFEYQDYFVKMEYSSTYPRLTFIIKFLPVLKGMALIHIYSQNKLSRNEEGKVQYKEFDILYGNEMNKDTGNIEYRYKEPKKLKENEWFFIEFLLSCNSSFGFFFYPKFELKYLDTSLLKLIQDNIEGNSQTSCEKVLYKITNSLYEEYLSNDKQKNSCSNEDNKSRFNDDSEKAKEKAILQKSEMITNYQWNCISKNCEGMALYQISKHFILSELFHSMIVDFIPDEATIIFSLIDNQSRLDMNNQNISQLISNDFSVLTKQFSKTNNKIGGVNEGLSIDKSLFNMNITNIGHEGKENVLKHFKQSKSETTQRKNEKELINKTTISKSDIVLNILNKSNYEYNNNDSEKSLKDIGSNIEEGKENEKNVIGGKLLAISYKAK